MIILCVSNIASANFEITEVMYDLEGIDASREWVEIKNTGDIPVDISKYFFFSDNTKHKLTSLNKSNIGVGEYAVIVQNDANFKSDWPSYSGNIFDSSWTDFSNTSESFSLMDENQKIIDTVSYSASLGANGNGYSLQKINGVWIQSKPTPGVENKLSLNPKPVVKTDTQTNTSSKNVENKGFSGELGNNFSSEKSNEIINLNKLDSGKEKSIIKELPIKIYYPYVGLGLLIIIGSLAIIFTRKNQRQDIWEKGLTAEDIKIIE